MRCVVCAIAKQENHYIYEWAKHHLDVGFVHLHIYDNNDIDGESIIDVFRGTDIEGQITIHDVRGMTKMQMVVYQQCYEQEDFDWCAFIDIDEFITFTEPRMSICDFLSDKQRFEAVHLNWLCYGDDGQLTSDGRDVRERFKHPIEPLDFKVTYITIPSNTHIKSIVRKGLSIDWNKPCDEMPWWSTAHTPAGLHSVCNDLGIEVRNLPWAKISHTTCFLTHYVTKTITEYGVKVHRPGADSNLYYHSYARFFRYNRFSFKKLLFIKRVSPETPILSIIQDVIKWWMFTHHLLGSWCYREYRRKLIDEKKIGIYILDGKEIRVYRFGEFLLKPYLWVKRILIGRSI